MIAILSPRDVDPTRHRSRPSGSGPPAAGIEARIDGVINDVVVVSGTDHHNRDPGGAVLRALAAEPRAVALDLTDARTSADTLPAALDVVDAYLRCWDGVPVLICADTWQQRRLLDKHPIRDRVTQFPSVEAGLVAAAAQPLPTKVSVDLDSSPQAPHQARQFLATAMQQWHATDVADDAALVISELVTNVVLHADARMSITISRAGTDGTLGRTRVRVAVGDAADGVPTIRHPSQVQVHGRGLLIVDELSVAWGTIPLDPGKVIWAVLDQLH